MTAVDLSTLPLDEVRARRAQARRAAELARLRGAATGESDGGEYDLLVAEVRTLTDELISRYAADLELVDSLLAPAAPDRLAEGGRP